MGFNGVVVVFRSTAAPAELAPHVGVRKHPVYATWSYSDGWQAVHVGHFERPYEFDETWIADLMARTGAPVLVCNVFESDVAHVRGASSAGTWEGWLDHGSAAGRLAHVRWDAFMLESSGGGEHGGGDGDGDEQDNAFPDPPRHPLDVFRQEAAESLELGRAHCAHDATQWAAAAGRQVPVEPIMRLLAARRDPFVQILFFRLLILLGIDDRPDPDLVRPSWKPAVDPAPLSTSVGQALKGKARLGRIE